LLQFNFFYIFWYISSYFDLVRLFFNNLIQNCFLFFKNCQIFRLSEYKITRNPSSIDRKSISLQETANNTTKFVLLKSWFSIYWLVLLLENAFDVSLLLCNFDIRSNVIRVLFSKIFFSTRILLIYWKNDEE
jgi:hypothetical protein